MKTNLQGWGIHLLERRNLENNIGEQKGKFVSRVAQTEIIIVTLQRCVVRFGVQNGVHERNSFYLAPKA